MSAAPDKAESAATLDLLARFESRNVTYQSPDGAWPIVWERAQGEKVWDVEGREYFDFTAAFGVAAMGHGRKEVVEAGQEQMGRLLHAMGDVHPHRGKGLLCKKLSEITFERWTDDTKRSAGKTMLCNSGFEAVEAALKTSLLFTGRSGVLAFQKGYHGLGYGALNVTSRGHFRGRFISQLREFGSFAPFPAQQAEAEETLEAARGLLAKNQIGAILVEPVQARGGINIPPPGFLSSLRKLADEFQAVLIFDEIYTGFGRTGKWFACERDAAIPDLICLGKGMTGGFPLSACVGRARLMDEAWPESNGEAIHTSTFLGHPVGCAMALANIHLMQSEPVFAEAEKRGALLEEIISSWRQTKNFSVVFRRSGLMAGLEIRYETSPCGGMVAEVVKEMLGMGFILLPEGEEGEVISFTPPLTITPSAIEAMCAALQLSLQRKGALS